MTIEELQSWAISQGANHYLRKLTLPMVTISPTEGVSLLLAAGDFLSIRLAGCLLFHPDLDIKLLLAGLSSEAKANLSHIVACGRRVDPDLDFWRYLEANVGAILMKDAPHWSRFCTHGKKGYPYMGQQFVWLKPNKSLFENLMTRKDYSTWK